LEGKPGVLGRADRFVETDPEHAPLARRLLGRTWIVENLGRAMELAATASPGLRLVTLAGELLESDGSLTVTVPIRPRKRERSSIRLRTR
jgi:chromosome segregation ATPase